MDEKQRDLGMEQISHGIKNVVLGHKLDTIDAEYTAEGIKERLDAIGSCVTDACDAITSELSEHMNEKDRMDFVAAIVMHMIDEQLTGPVLQFVAKETAQIAAHRDRGGH